MLASLSFPEHEDVSPMYEELMEKENPVLFILMGVLSFYLWEKIVSSPIRFSSEN